MLGPAENGPAVSRVGIPDSIVVTYRAVVAAVFRGVDMAVGFGLGV